MTDRRLNIPLFLIAMALLFIVGLCLSLFAQERTPRSTQIEYVKNAIKRTDLRDDEFLVDGRKDVTALGTDLLACWSELDRIKQILLERGP